MPSTEEIGKMTTAEFMQTYAKVVYCRSVECAWNDTLPENHDIKWNNLFVPLGDNDGYPGVCGRSSVGVTPRDVSSSIGGVGGDNRRRIVHTCDAFSDRHLKGHVDFTKFITPERIN